MHSDDYSIRPSFETGDPLGNPAPSRSEAFYRLLVENTGAILWEADPATLMFTFVGGGVEQVLGYPRAAWYEKDFWVTHLHPEDRDRAVQFCKERTQQGVDHRLEYRMIGVDGREIWVDDLVSVQVENSRIIGLRGVLIDITERTQTEHALRASEERFRMHFNQDPLAIFEWRWEGNCFILRGYNEAAMRFTRGNIVKLMGSEASELFSDRPDIVADMHACMNTRQPITRQMEYVMRVTGEPKNIITRHVYVPPDTIMIHIEDITQRKEAEKRAMALQSQLAHVARLSTMEELAIGLAHEMNQPLAAIANFAGAGLIELASGKSAGGEMKGNLERIEAQAHRLSDILRRFRRFIRRQDTSRDRFDLNDAVSDVVHLMEYELRTRHIEVRRELAPDLPEIAADGIGIQQVILNLIRNGAEAMDRLLPEQRVLTIQTGHGENGGVRFSLRDEGSGVVFADRDRLFEPFFTTKADGLGLGLSLSRSIIESHGGRLDAAANPHGGMTFFFELPTGRGTA